MGKKSYFKEITLYAIIMPLILLGLVKLDAFEWFYEFSRAHEGYELDEIVLIIPAITVCLAIFSLNRMLDVRRRAKSLEESRKELASTNAELTQLTQARNEFLTMASHELRSPLVGIVNSLNLIKLAEDEHEREECIEYAISAATGMSSLINDVLSFARLSKGEVEEVAPFAPSALIESIQTMAQLQADAKGLELQAQLDKSVPEIVTGNETGLRLVVLNLVGNSIKFTESGGVTVSMMCPRGQSCSELVVKVTDTGVGISSEDQAVIFEPYRTVGKGKPGIGLGLSLVSTIVEKMGGSISVSSASGQGSEFTVRVPIRPA